MKNETIKIILLLVCAFATSVNATILQWKVEDGGNGHWYDYTIEGTWQEAEDYAIAQGGHLTAINSQEENDWLYQNFFTKTPDETSNTPYWGWIGLYQEFDSPDFSEPSGGWSWSNGEPVTFTNWVPAITGQQEPNNQSGREHWAQMYPSWNSVFAGYWNDWRIEDITPVHGVMEIPEPCTLLLLGLGAVMVRKKQ